MKLVKILALFSVFQVSANHLICLQNKPLINVESLYEKLNIAKELYELGYHHAKSIDPNDYALVNTPDGYQTWLQKSQITGYQPQFNLEMVSIDQAPSAIRQILGTSYETDSKYFAKKFKNVFPEKVFHSLGNYRYKGFCEFVKKLPGFEEFILT